MGDRTSMRYRYEYRVMSIWDKIYRYGYLPNRYGHPGYGYGMWASDMGDVSIDMVILRIDTGYLVTLPASAAEPFSTRTAPRLSLRVNRSRSSFSPFR